MSSNSAIPLILKHAGCKTRAVSPRDDDPRSDQQVVEAINAGDAEAFEVLYRRHRDWVAGLAYRFTLDHDDALDVLQEAYWYFARQFPGFELRAKLTTYLYPVVKHIALAQRRRKRPDQELPDVPAPPIVDSPDRENPRAALAEVLTRLSEEHREVVLMRYVDDMSLDEIAQAMAIPLGTVKSRLHHALAALREDPRTRKYFQTK
jgi:RNA polymerase sigma-70 factor (ECF subfamily)